MQIAWRAFQIAFVGAYILYKVYTAAFKVKELAKESEKKKL